MKHCAKCNLEYPDTSRFCKGCGAELATAGTAVINAPCPSCGATVLSGWKFCKQCGQSFDEITVVNARPASPVQTAVAVSPSPAANIAAAAVPAIVKSQAITVTPARGEECPACGHRNEAGAEACEACGAAVGASARKLRIKRGARVASVLLGLSIFVIGAAALGWYLLGVSATIQTDPGDSKIVIDGEAVGQTNAYGSLTTRRLRVGDHSLAVMRDGYDTWKQDFSIAFTDLGKSVNVKLNLTKYKLTVISSPPGSEVLVDSNSMGSTSEGSGKLETPPLAPGAHTVLVRSEGYRDWKQSVDLKNDMQLEATLSSAPVIDQNASSAEGEVRSALDGWVQSVQNRDIDSHMRYYADTLDYYYARTVVPSSKVRDDRTKAFQKFNTLSVQLSNVNIQLDSTGQRATVVFDKTFDFRSDGGNFFLGSVQDQLTFTKLGGAWLITGEKELKIYNVKS